MNVRSVDGEVLSSSANRPASGGPLGVFAELLYDPNRVLERFEQPGWAGAAVTLLAVAVACCTVYGAAAGLFQGGSQVAVAAMKAPVVVLGSLALCLPSFYVFTALAGAPLSGRRTAALLAGLCGMIGWLMVGLLPVNWLFSVSSRSLAFMVLLHLAVWSVALTFAFRFLLLGIGEAGRKAVCVWMLLFAVVSLQVTVCVRPVLVRPEGAPLFEPGKKFFVETLSEVFGPPRPPYGQPSSSP